VLYYYNYILFKKHRIIIEKDYNVTYRTPPFVVHSVCQISNKIVMKITVYTVSTVLNV